jgi:ABC-type enterobactin transport system permease subunit
MAAVVWVTLGIALWHFTVFVPDHFRGGIVGAFVGAILGAVVTGAIYQVVTGDSLGTTDIVTMFAAVPGCLLGLGIVYLLGLRDEEANPPGI